MHSHLHNQLRRNKARQNLKQFAGLITTPGDLAVGFPLPANGKLFVSNDVVTAVVTNYVTVRGVEFAGAPGQAGDKHPIGTAGEQAVVKKSTTAQGTVSLYVQDGMGNLLLIGQG